MGGIRSAGDITKAIYFGADFVMIGKLLASTDLSHTTNYNSNKQIIPAGKEVYPDKITDREKIGNENNIVRYKGYHGMASRAARANILSYAGVEGAEGLINYSCTTEKFLLDTKLRLQSSLSYAGARSWEELRKRVTAYKRSISRCLCR